ncbi:peptidylprolyl isomerase [Dokdonia sp. MED134]|uniref:peptidylprolyl isomerase n=1 Tax=Dokdonia sp. MED134 TaxID=313590 RepID=UPI000068AB32|nr:peptidylprolyl isomerase [Dokdonia sp. MED134]EAQ40395.1 peptidylprolyl isomerase [Dokdonia sp. MED134]
MRYLFIVCFFMPFVSLGQQEVLLKVNNDEVTTADFVRVYEKNLALINDTEENSPEQYLDLFIDYKLKVQEAYRKGLHNKASYKKEIASYRTQLGKDYLNDVQVTDKLVEEAYNRTKNELRARHILVRVRPDALPKDTLAAFNKLLEARKRIVAGEDFAFIASKYSEDPSAKQNGGDLGWFKAFKMVYPFENAAYTTKVNEVSQPFRTSFGYHIVQPTASRIAQGSVQVAHIMIALKQKDSSIIAEEKIKEVRALLAKGAAFETLALNYSDDKNSAKKGGVLSAFEKGQLSSSKFENTAFDLKKVGDISEPFKTKFGWHILKLIKKNPVLSFEKMKPSLTKRVTKDSRARVLSQELNTRLREQYKITQEPEITSYFTSVLPEVYEEKLNVFTDDSALSKEAFKVGDQVITYKDIAQVLEKKYRKVPYVSRDYFVKREVENFVNNALITYHKSHLEEQDSDFGLLINEYKEGLLLFDLLKTEIWDKAQKDSVGLNTFYVNNIERYKALQTFTTRVFTTSQKKIASTYLKRNTQGENSNSVLSVLKKKHDSPIIITLKDFVKEDLPMSGIVKIGDKELLKEGGNYVVYEVVSINEAMTNTLQNVRGQVMSDYQKFLEDIFVNRLREDSNITVNKTVLNKLISRYNE